MSGESRLLLKGLLTAAAARARAHEALEAVAAGDGQAFRLDRSRLDETAAFVAETARAAYPTLDIPPHSRWRHFERPDGGSDWADVAARQDWADARARAMAEIDLAFVSVLLDAGAGADWSYLTHDGRRLGRSEGLAAASLDMFQAGHFSADPDDPLRVDAVRLAALSAAELAKGMQSGAWSPAGAAVVGLDGRRRLLANLAAALRAAPDVFGRETPRPGGLYDWAAADRADAPALLTILLERLAPIWPQGLKLEGVALGDVWRHPGVRRADATDGLLPLHKLTQWLVYSLVEPFDAAGAPLGRVEALTGLAEYRNGGLFVDFGVLVPIDPEAAGRSFGPGDILTIEWRAATLALLDELAPRVRAALDAPGLTLPQLLQAGTWTAGRRIARARRPGGPPPFAIQSDGTVF